MVASSNLFSTAGGSQVINRWPIPMARRTAKNRTGLPRIRGVRAHDAWVGFACVRCGTVNHIRVGDSLVVPDDAFENSRWTCSKCRFAHHKDAGLPFKTWPKGLKRGKSLETQR